MLQERLVKKPCTIQLFKNKHKLSVAQAHSCLIFECLTLIMYFQYTCVVYHYICMVLNFFVTLLLQLFLPNVCNESILK